MKTTSIILDCDPGVDDALTLFLAFASPELEILGITTVAGNISGEYTARNARIIRQIGRRTDIPVYAGCTGPMIREIVEAGEFHGESGLGELEIFEPEAPLAGGHAVLALIDMIMSRRAGSVTLVATGPLTNVAMALRLEPRLVDHLGPVVIMGGARREGGNIIPSAEFNIHADPHAAKIVFECGLKTVVFGLDVTHTIRATPPRTEAIQALTTPAGKTAAKLLEFANRVEFELEGGIGTPMHDPCTVAWLLKPELFKLKPCLLEVEINSELTLGHTAVDFHIPEGVMTNCEWAYAGDADGVFALLTERLAREGGAAA